MQEVSAALKSTGSLKASGPNGFHVILFKKTWGITAQAVYDFVPNVLEGGMVPGEAAEVLLVLISKELKPSMIKNFMPISLCNVIFKLATKLIVNRLKRTWSEIISPNEASFIPGRQSIDNVVVCQELILSLKYTKARRGE